MSVSKGQNINGDIVCVCVSVEARESPFEIFQQKRFGDHIKCELNIPNWPMRLLARPWSDLVRTLNQCKGQYAVAIVCRAEILRLTPLRRTTWLGGLGDNVWNMV
jgi:hypothetical protein